MKVSRTLDQYEFETEEMMPGVAYKYESYSRIVRSPILLRI